MNHGLAGSYSAGCRCPDCRRAWRDYKQRNYRQRAYQRAQNDAARWVRQHRRDIWAQLFDDALMKIRAERRP